MKLSREEAIKLNKKEGERLHENSYTKTNARFVDGEWWYYSDTGTYRERLFTHAKKNKTRMFVDGKYIPKSHPLHKAGRYKSFNEAQWMEKLNTTTEGFIYIISNPAWEFWYKIGKAIDVNDRLNGYQTSSPFRNYVLEYSRSFKDRNEAERIAHTKIGKFSTKRKGEWFYCNLNDAKKVIEEI